MKTNLLKTLTKFGLGLLVIGLLFSAILPSPSHAADLELIGNKDGLEILPVDEKLFDLGNMKPGDTANAKIDIENKYSDPIELYMRTERVSQKYEEGDLFGQLLLVVQLGNKEIYSGPMSGFASTNISLGIFDPKDMAALKAGILLPGRETGNEFQDKDLVVKWIFTAQARPEEFKGKEEEEKKPKLPKTGEEVLPMAFYGAGILLVGLGIVIRRKRKK
ncbi:MAG: LPXTG cell wall anchor domain-containing protein [Clostridiales bacterium]|nr:LPXTG cell wall anchor domain-containing protein [Clostridiales bacterium]